MSQVIQAWNMLWSSSFRDAIATPPVGRLSGLNAGLSEALNPRQSSNKLNV